MSLSAESVARQLLDAHATRQRFASFSADNGIRGLEDSYAVQAALVAELCRGQGARPVGYKIGLTSLRMQQMTGIDRPIAGVVLSGRVHQSGSTLSLSQFGRLGLECEIGVRLGRDLDAAGAPYDRESVAAAVEAICPAFELVDDRNADYAVLDVLSLVADNSWNGGIVLGPFGRSWSDLAALSGRFETNGVEIDRGRGSDVLGHPFEPLAWLANHLAARGGGLVAGDLVVTGSLCRTRFPGPGEHWRFSLEGLGSVELTTAP